jgi:hypothetical protein
VDRATAGENARLLARSWTMRAALQTAREVLRPGTSCQVCGATARYRAENGLSGIANVQLWLTDHAHDCAYRAVVEALEGIE